MPSLQVAVASKDLPPEECQNNAGSGFDKAELPKQNPVRRAKTRPGS
jgi:hypothetical protein